MSESLGILITGCASGIGAHLAGLLASRGHRVLATDIDEGGLADRATKANWSGDRVRRAILDVRSEEAWDAAIAEARHAFGGLDVVMNVAGYLRPGWVADTTRKDVDLHLDVNVKGTILGTRAAAKHMIPRRRGHIVNFGSLASLAPTPGLSLYAASKFAVRGFSLAAATELRAHGVAVTVVMPDAVETPMLDLQVGYEEAALTFSGSRALTVAEIGAFIVDKVLPKRPLEAAIPAGRAGLARIANAAPALTQAIAPFLMKRGRAAQEKRKKK